MPRKKLVELALKSYMTQEERDSAFEVVTAKFRELVISGCRRKRLDYRTLVRDIPCPNPDRVIAFLDGERGAMPTQEDWTYLLQYTGLERHSEKCFACTLDGNPTPPLDAVRFLYKEARTRISADPTRP